MPSDEDLKIIAKYLFENKNNYNIFLQAEKNEILIALNNKNEVSFINYPYEEKNSFVEKIYNYNKSIWNLSIVLSKEKLLDIVNILFSQDFNKNNMLIKIKQIITEIKKKIVLIYLLQILMKVQLMLMLI
ncbi:hypothetical protein [Spiroplasma endosymbiont of Ammophila pubescens]|uniref:hypothetical protein n=1 Tax=Spiroplasma endosymbiont of Ammophila pubescens TaxID=3066315 RepID=UPI0032B1231D